ncbi:hypothetical protein MUDAN_MDHGFNIF_03379 [Lactiplantibacillus mudanjiangensis]|uniref:Uncharacterized protein n=1 Tax=Lactiplantibacillus mudanjiangensis TaxID=1296538 RepID=A0A660DZY2_9LACO|nr:hypothetical protein MUDAN_IGPPGNFN_02827 [Lactiplantibacillus mudanjiangensis]VDG28988.1 hypothetical protein MUDAN_MDHGFNIF_03379 [Lactiplantibacillus mudanjiangensis]
MLCSFGSRAWQQYVYASDMRQVHRADVVVAILDFDMTSATNEPDSGTMFEIGAAVAEKTPVIVVQFDANKELNLTTRKNAACKRITFASSILTNLN